MVDLIPGLLERAPTLIGIHSGQKEESLTKRTTHHFIRGIPISANAQHPGQDDFSTHPSGLPQPFRL